jgi:hypothetical protein
MDFLPKAQRAREAGARALVVAQTEEVWPFNLQDKAGEYRCSDTAAAAAAAGGGGTRPAGSSVSDSSSCADMSIFCVRLSDAKLLADLCRKVDQGVVVECTFGDPDCCICQGGMVLGDVVYKLPCR